MGLPKSQNKVGLGHAILNKQAKEAKIRKNNKDYSVEVDSTTKLKSVTQERDLDEFLNTAQLAGTEFTAEKQNVKIISAPGLGGSSAANPFLLSAEDEEKALSKHSQHKKSLRVPRRPPWKKSMTAAEIDRQEKDAFLDWRRGLATLQEAEDLIFTPFERNLEVWRQLWRVLERSHLVVQIIDARNPLRFRCEDLEDYVHDVEGPEGESGTGTGLRKTLLLVNKADLLTTEQRRQWADYFDENNITYAFFSAANAKALQEARAAEQLALLKEQERRERGSDDEDEDEDDSDATDSDDESVDHSYADGPPPAQNQAAAEEEDHDPRTRVLSVLELESLFVNSAPDISLFGQDGVPPPKLVVGLVGYPNVGKSSTINALLGEKKVSVSSTPGKTKHFQTIHLSPTILLCDCPGLVFPQFATSKADLVCDGVLPIDQMREYTAPVQLIVRRIPTPVLEGIYGLVIRRKSIEEGGTGKITAEDFLITYAIGRGFTRAGQGNPDEARAARFILKDYVNGRLLFCHPPPSIDGEAFNAAQQQFTVEALQAAGKKMAPVTRVGKGADTFVPPELRPSYELDADGNAVITSIPQSNTSRKLDSRFFESESELASRPFVQGSAQNGKEHSRTMLYPHQNAVGNDGTPAAGTYAPVPVGTKQGKKHFKGKQHVKQRSGRGYD